MDANLVAKAYLIRDSSMGAFVYILLPDKPGPHWLQETGWQEWCFHSDFDAATPLGGDDSVFIMEAVATATRTFYRLHGRAKVAVCLHAQVLLLENVGGEASLLEGKIPLLPTFNPGS